MILKSTEKMCRSSPHRRSKPHFVVISSQTNAQTAKQWNTAQFNPMCTKVVSVSIMHCWSFTIQHASTQTHNSPETKTHKNNISFSLLFTHSLTKIKMYRLTEEEESCFDRCLPVNICSIPLKLTN